MTCGSTGTRRAVKSSVNAEHGVLENEFQQYLTKIGATGISRNVAGIDVSFRHPTVGDVIAELKPASHRPDSGISTLLQATCTSNDCSGIKAITEGSPVRDGSRHFPCLEGRTIVRPGMG